MPLFVYFMLSACGLTASDVATGKAGGATAEVTIIETPNGELKQPWDIAFNGTDPNEMWVVNYANNSTVTFRFEDGVWGSPDEKLDPFRHHYMHRPSSIAWGVGETFATCQDSRNEEIGYLDFMGPVYWPGDERHAQSNPAAVAELTEQYGSHTDLGSHLDMNHESPLCMGITHKEANQFFVFDGSTTDGEAGDLFGLIIRATEENREALKEHFHIAKFDSMPGVEGEFAFANNPRSGIVLYDFVEDHGPGMNDHTDGIIHRYYWGNDEGSIAPISRVAGKASHLAYDSQTGLLYIADTDRILVLDTNTGTPTYDLYSREDQYLEPGDSIEHKLVEGAEVRELRAGLIDKPEGIAIDTEKNVLYVTSDFNRQLRKYDLDGALLDKLELQEHGLRDASLKGIEIGPDGKIYIADSSKNRIIQVANF